MKSHSLSPSSSTSLSAERKNRARSTIAPIDRTLRPMRSHITHWLPRSASLRRVLMMSTGYFLCCSERVRADVEAWSVAVRGDRGQKAGLLELLDEATTFVPVDRHGEGHGGKATRGEEVGVELKRGS